MKKLVWITVLMGISIICYGDSEKNLSTALNEIVVYRSPSCGCCGKWIKHLELNGFKVDDRVTEHVQNIKEQYGVNKELASCHTAVIGGYIVEGHVPAEDIKKMLQSKPNIKGLSVPGMVPGSPGMEMDGRKDSYNVVSFDKAGKQKIYKAYEKY
jgi:hypothetical protein